MLLEMYEVVLSDATALQELKRGKEEVRAFFEQRNTPQPSTKNEGCIFLTGDHPQIDKMVGKSDAVDYGHDNMFAETINTDHGKQEDSFTDEQIARALEACVGKGKVIDNKQKWAGGYWFLRWVCNFPVDVKKCCERIIRRICTCSFMEYDARVLNQVKAS